MQVFSLFSTECYILNHFRVITKILCTAESIVRKRRKYRRTSLTWKRESLISFHPDRFFEPLLPCKFSFITSLFVCKLFYLYWSWFSPGCSSKLQLLFSRKKMKLPDSLKIVEASGNLHLQESPTIATPLSPPHNDIPIVPETLSLSTNENEFPSLLDEVKNNYKENHIIWKRVKIVRIYENMQYYLWLCLIYPLQLVSSKLSLRILFFYHLFSIMICSLGFMIFSKTELLL